MTLPGRGTDRGSPRLHDEQARDRSASTAFLWSFANTVSARLGTLAIGIVLARLLGPEEFGTYAVAFIALLAVLSFNELGVSLAIVRWTEDPRDIAPTVTAISLVTSAVITVAMMFAAGPFASAMGDPEAAGLVRLLSLCVLINGVVATPAALLQRYFRQDQRMICDQVNVWLGALVSLALALSGVGAMSLVVGRLAGALVSGVMLVAYSPLPFAVGLDVRHVRPLLRFGAPLAGASIIVFAVGFVDQFAVGHIVGSVALGYYVLAFNLASWPVSLFSQPLRSVAPAMFSRLQNNRDAMTESFNRLVKVLAAVALPICVVLAAAAEDVIRFVYGPDWAPAATALRWLAAMAAFRIFFELTYDYLVVLRRSGTILWIQVVWLAALVPLVTLGVHRYGIAGAGAALVIVASLVGMPLYVRSLRQVGIEPWNLVRQTRIALAASAVLCAVIIGATNAISGSFFALAVSGLVTLAFVAGLLWICRNDLVALRTERRVVTS